MARQVTALDDPKRLGVLVAELPLKAETERRTVRYIKEIAVERIGQRRRAFRRRARHAGPAGRTPAQVGYRESRMNEARPDVSDRPVQ